MRKIFKTPIRLVIALSLLILPLLSGCKKENACNDVVQDDFELVE